MALYAFDGTWREDEEEPQEDTNVVRFRDLYEGPVEYRAGVGTRWGAIGRVVGGLFGAGGRSRIEEMYEALTRNWARGDKAIDLIGFSRGAALAVHFANVLEKVGIRAGESKKGERPVVRFLGLWDVVGSFGIPIDLVIRFHDIDVGWSIDRVPPCVEHCFHALALDERRQTFEPKRLNAGNVHPNVEELWFRGVHGDVGGGNGNVARNLIALHWMLEKARECGLPIPPQAIERIGRGRDEKAPMGEPVDPIRNPRRPVLKGDRYHPTAQAKTLGIGQSLSFPVRSSCKFNWSGVRLAPGATYEFAPAGRWMDGGINCDAAGWKSEDLPWFKEPVVRWAEKLRRCAEADWFELVGSEGDEGDLLFRIGAGGPDRRHVARSGAELWAFANDLDSKYENNRGQLSVTVTRVA